MKYTLASIGRKLLCMSVFFVGFNAWSHGELGHQNINIATSDATIRAPLPGMDNTVAYVTFANQSANTIRLISASSEISDNIEFHDHVMRNDMMKMVQVDEIVIPGHESKTLQSGGLHLMIFNVGPIDNLDKEIIITFKTDTNESLTVPFKVKKLKMHHH